MQVLNTPLRDVRLIQPKRFGDNRGWFAEVFNQSNLFHRRSSHPICPGQPVFLDERGPSRPPLSTRPASRQTRPRTLRPYLGRRRRPPAQLARLRKMGRVSPQKPVARRRPRTPLDPRRLCHGFLVLSETAEVLYKTTNLYYPAGERSILWNDPTLNINWPLESLNGTPPSVSSKDERGALFSEADLPPE